MTIGLPLACKLTLVAPPDNLTIFGIHVYLVQTVRLCSPSGRTETVESPRQTILEAGYLDRWRQPDFVERARTEHRSELLCDGSIQGANKGDVWEWAAEGVLVRLDIWPVLHSVCASTTHPCSFFTFSARQQRSQADNDLLDRRLAWLDVLPRPRFRRLLPTARRWAASRRPAHDCNDVQERCDGRQVRPRSSGSSSLKRPDTCVNSSPAAHAARSRPSRSLAISSRRHSNSRLPTPLV